MVFNPLPSHEGRLSKSSRIGSILTLQSTPLSRGETWSASVDFSPLLVFNPLPSHEGRPLTGYRQSLSHSLQSTPLSRGETSRLLTNWYTRSLQSTPLSRGETILRKENVILYNLQSTPLSRGETIFCFWHLHLLLFFNPLPSHEGRQQKPPIFNLSTSNPLCNLHNHFLY